MGDTHYRTKEWIENSVLIINKKQRLGGEVSPAASGACQFVVGESHIEAKFFNETLKHSLI